LSAHPLPAYLRAMTDNPGIGRLLATLALGVLAATVVTRITDPLIAVLAHEFDAPVGRAALLASVFALPFALIQPILGPVGDALGKRRIIAIGLAILSVILAISSLAPGLDTLLVLRGLAGLAAGMVMPLAIALVGDSVGMKDRQVALSRLLAFAITGQIAGGSISGLLEPYLGWRGVMLAAAALAAVAVAAVLLGGRGQPPEARHPFTPMQALQRYRALLGMREAVVLYVSVAVEGALIFGSFPYYAPLLHARGMGGTAEAGLAVAAFGAGGLIYAAIAKAVLRRIGQNRMVMLGGTLCVVAFAGFAFAPVSWMFIASGLFLGVGMYMVHNSIQTRVTEVAPQARGSAVALHAFHFFVGQTIGPVLFGLALSGLGRAPTMLLAGAGMFTLAMLLSRHQPPRPT
jgi:predicted MFS family arabinose efflux permease